MKSRGRQTTYLNGFDEGGNQAHTTTEREHESLTVRLHYRDQEEKTVPQVFLPRH